MKILLVLSTFCLIVNGAYGSAGLFQASQSQPYQLSVGAIVFDQNGNVVCHRIKDLFASNDRYLLMQESMEIGETPLMTLSRGLMSQFGATAVPIAFLGSLVGNSKYSNLIFENTILYFACQLVDLNPANQTALIANSVVESIAPSLLISLMQQHITPLTNPVDVNEWEMISRASTAF